MTFRSNWPMYQMRLKRFRTSQHLQHFRQIDWRFRPSHNTFCRRRDAPRLSAEAIKELEGMDQEEPLGPLLAHAQS